jgi:membrane protease YdiL (CAAX protease family)
LQVVFRDSGLDTLHAADLSYLITWPVLLLLLFPVLRESGDALRRLFDPSRLSVRLVLSGIAIGLMLRLAWWSQLIAGISFGMYSNADADAIVGPQLAFQCPPARVAALGILVMAVLVPVTEELIHRGFIQSALYRFGPCAAITGSAIVFTVLHRPDSWVFVFVAGVVLGTQFWITRSLWSSLFTHTTINGLIQLDWRCLRGQWNPASSDLPLAMPGTISALLFAVCSTTICAVLWQLHRGDRSPR